MLKRIVPGYCRAALEAAFISVVRRKMLAAGYELPPTSVELLGWLGTVEELVARVTSEPKS